MVSPCDSQLLFAKVLAIAYQRVSTALTGVYNDIINDDEKTSRCPVHLNGFSLFVAASFVKFYGYIKIQDILPYKRTLLCLCHCFVVLSVH